MDFGGFCSSIAAIDKMPILLLIAVILIVWMLYKAHRGPNSFDIKDLISDTITGKVSLLKFAQAGSFFVTSWMIVYLTLHDKLTEPELLIYAGAWTGVSIASQGISAFGRNGSSVTTVDTEVKSEDNKTNS